MICGFQVWTTIFEHSWKPTRSPTFSPFNVWSSLGFSNRRDSDFIDPTMFAFQLRPEVERPFVSKFVLSLFHALYNQDLTEYVNIYRWLFCNEMGSFKIHISYRFFPAFVLPIVQALRGRVVPRVRALVILPVQELAAQVNISSFLCCFLNFKFFNTLYSAHLLI